MISLYRIQYYLVTASLFLLPFNSLPVFNYALGEATGEGALYPLFFGCLIYGAYVTVSLMYSGKLQVKNKQILLIVICFLFVTFVSYIYNVNSIYNNLYLGKNGLVRYWTQYSLLLFVMFSVFYISSVIRDEEDLKRLINVCSYTFILVFLFSILQFYAYYFKVGFALYNLIGGYIYEEGVIEYALERRAGLGLHSVSQEPSFLAMYVAVVFPYVVLSKSNVMLRIVFFSLGVALIVLTWSRTAYVIFVFQLLLICFLYYFHYISLKRIVFYIPLFFIFVALVLFTESKLSLILMSVIDVENSGSSAARLGAAYSAMVLWFDGHSLLGVGLGQAGYYLIDYLPQWAFLSGDAYDVVNGVRWPPIHNFWIRLLAEVGVIGVLLFLMLFMYIVIKVNRVVKEKYLFNKEKDFIGYAVLTSLVGAFLIMFNRETITNMNVWVSLGFALGYLNINKRNAWSER